MDLYDFSETTGADPLTAASSGSNATGVPQQTLEQEVNQVFGQLGRFWGGFRKQVRRRWSRWHGEIIVMWTDHPPASRLRKECDCIRVREEGPGRGR